MTVKMANKPTTATRAMEILAWEEKYSFEEEEEDWRLVRELSREESREASEEVLMGALLVEAVEG